MPLVWELSCRSCGSITAALQCAPNGRANFSVQVLGLTAYAFQATKRGVDFSFMGTLCAGSGYISVVLSGAGHVGAAPCSQTGLPSSCPHPCRRPDAVGLPDGHDCVVRHPALLPTRACGKHHLCAAGRFPVQVSPFEAKLLGPAMCT